jgi:hypothetical protein
VILGAVAGRSALTHTERPPRRALIAITVGVVALVLLGGLAAARLLVGRSEREAVSLVRGAPGRARKAKFFAMSLTVSYEAPGQQAKHTESTGELAVDAGRAHLRLFPVLADRQLELVSDAHTLYVSIPYDRQPQHGGARWLRVDAGSVEAAQGAGLGPIPDPLSFLAALGAVKGPLEQLGRRRDDGVDVRVYRGRVSVADLRRRLPVAQARALAGLGRGPLAVEVSIDGDDRPRRETVTAQLGDKGTLTSVLELSRFGEPIVVGIPPLDATIPAPDLATALRVAGGAPG